MDNEREIDMNRLAYMLSGIVYGIIISAILFALFLLLLL